MISSQKSILWPYQYSLSIWTTSPISRYLEGAIIWEVKIYIFNGCKKKGRKTITCGFQVPPAPRRTQEWMQEVWGLQTWGQITPFHCFIFFFWRRAGGQQWLTFTYEWNLAIQCNGLQILTWQNLPTFGTLRARWLCLPPTRSCSQSCAEIEAAAEFQVKQEHNWKCDRYIHIVAMFF